MLESHTLEPVNPVRPVAPWVGGKRALSRRLVEMIGRVPHRRYAEPFVGMGGVFFRRNLRPRVEIINDISEDVTTLFRVLQRHYQAFLDMIRWQLSSRAEFARLMKVDPTTLTDLERAARFLYLQRLTFGGKVDGRTFGVDATNGARFNLTKLVPMLEDVHDRLVGVTIERLPYQQFITRYDSPETLFYLDPPYWGTEDYYGPGLFSEADYGALRGLLEALEGSFIMTINDCPQSREMFAPFHIQPVELHYTVGVGARAVKELVITSPKCHT